MRQLKWPLKFPHLYAYLLSKKRIINYEKQIYLHEIKKGNTVFDIGANVGNYSILFSYLCGRRGFVHCFEPVIENYQSLLLSLSGTKNTKANNIAAGDEDTVMDISYDPSDCEKSSLLNVKDSISSVQSVQVQALDNYCGTLGLRKLDFVKCDVEGYEFKALKGMENTLRLHLPKISVEITMPKYERTEFIGFLMELGYNSFQKIEKGYPKYDIKLDHEPDDSYFYLYATS